MPDFGLEYGRRRAEKDAARRVLDRERYELMPQHDINGVNLLYYAAYPLIADICQMRRSGQGAAWASATSPVARDTHYFANAEIMSVLEWRLHEDADGDGLRTESSIVRDDGAVMAFVQSRKAAT
jgi:probable biosynthetic protein (TIGR04098 family)